MSLPQRRRLAWFLCITLVASGTWSCATRNVEREFVAPTHLRDLSRLEHGPLKVHLLDGSLCVLPEWSFDEATQELTGEGQRWNGQRELVASGPMSVAFDEIALLETNRVLESRRLMGLAIVGGISAVLTINCAKNPKNCFGSCPTFYVGGSDQIRAEGFSASIAPCLEAFDVDALGECEVVEGRLAVTMQNEALETHVVRQVDLLVFPTASGVEMVAGTDGRFYQARDAVSPRSCRDELGDWSEAVSRLDGNWRSVPADSLDLSAKEELFVEFDRVPQGPLGLVISARQSLLTTYLFYQSLAWMGTQAGWWLAQLERGALPTGGGAVSDLLGRIEVELAGEDGEWVPVGSCGETGPLATDSWCLPLETGSRDWATPLEKASMALGIAGTDAESGGDMQQSRAANSPVRVRLRTTRGLYRFDRLALVSIEDAGPPTRLRPLECWSSGQIEPGARAALVDSNDVLVTLPGEAYELVYSVPVHLGHRCEVFLESRGYYLEWMRREWESEEDPLRLSRLLWQPEVALREMAPAFKGVEAEMESMFWASRYAMP